MEFWAERYIGKPWAAIPRPPESFTCGELVRHIMRERCGVDMPEIVANPTVVRECIRDIEDAERYGLYLLRAGEQPQEYDVAYLVQVKKQSHVGIAVDTSDGLLILHCVQRCGVFLSSPAELLGHGYRRIDWRRHHLLGGVACPK